jgi:hypothetical protein
MLKDVIDIHKKQFVAFTKTLKSAIQLADISLKINDLEKSYGQNSEYVMVL